MNTNLADVIGSILFIGLIIAFALWVAIYIIEYYMCNGKNEEM